HLTHQDGQPPTLSYRIGQRNSIQTRQSPAGTEIAVTFWHELRKDSDICYLGRDGTTLAGTLQVHANHITPTRCELHSLLVGLHDSGDAALQICDNTKAIGLVVLARSLKRRGGLPRYSNIYRVELRSLMALYTDTGTFTGEWIRSHQDPADTPDPILRTKRTLLAEADSLATLAHQLLPLTTYAHLIIPDYWELRDDHDRPITGATAPWLGAVYGRSDWPKAQARKPDTRQTIQPLRIPTGDICKWDLPALNFYWRAICYTLHTNARKHRIYPRWEPHCRTCPASIDTQEHRFGLSHPICPMSVPLSQKILLATQAILPKAWLPDQDIYLPGHSTATAHILPGLKRPKWKSRGGNPSPNTGTCMIPLTAQRCVHALHMQRLLPPPQPESLMLAASQLSWESH
ncbi:hypothetical protein DYB28_015291, partial [Aphanomyces astaci]